MKRITRIHKPSKKNFTWQSYHYLSDGTKIPHRKVRTQVPPPKFFIAGAEGDEMDMWDYGWAGKWSSAIQHFGTIEALLKSARNAGMIIISGRWNENEYELKVSPKGWGIGKGWTKVHKINSLLRHGKAMRRFIAE